jgi:hypothetical protein
MDDLAEQIEAAMDGTRTSAQGRTRLSILESDRDEVIEDDGRSDPLVGIVDAHVLGDVPHEPGAPANLDDFLTVDAKQKLVGGVASTTPAEDTFTVQETPP